MSKDNILRDILYFLMNELKLKNISIKEFTSIVYLIDWEYSYEHDYRLFNYKWSNMIEDNIVIVQEELIDDNIQFIRKNRYLDLHIPNKENVKDLKGYTKEATIKVLKKEFILSKATFYFYETLHFDLFYKVDKHQKEYIDVIKLIEMKKNKEY